jgi:hypothetical protein
MAKMKCQSVRESHCTRQGEASGTREESLLSPRRAFVVQFRTETEVTQERFAGRVEHIVSGHAAHFHSPEELWAFFTNIPVNVQE